MSATGFDVFGRVDDPYLISPARIAHLLDGAPWRRFVVIGDSIAEGVTEETPGYGAAPWAERVAEALRAREPELDYLNLGERYLTAEQVRDRQLTDALAFEPDLASVVCGGNDVLAPELDEDRLERTLDELIGSLTATGADVITFRMFDISRALELPREFGEHIHDRLGLLAEMMSGLAKRYRTIHVDLGSLAASADPSIYASDRMHASTRGHAICASATIEALGGRLGNL